MLDKSLHFNNRRAVQKTRYIWCIQSCSYYSHIVRNTMWVMKYNYVISLYIYLLGKKWRTVIRLLRAMIFLLLAFGFLLPTFVLSRLFFITRMLRIGKEKKIVCYIVYVPPFSFYCYDYDYYYINYTLDIKYKTKLHLAKLSCDL